VAGLVPAEVGPRALITYQFVHADALHLFVNLLFLWAVGGIVETAVGAAWFTVAYLGCGVVAGLTHVATHLGSSEPVIGASGAVAGIMGLLAIRQGRAPLRLALVAMAFVAPGVFLLTWPAWVFLALWFAEQVFFAALGPAAGQVAFLAHLGGFGAGAVLGLALGRRPQPPPA
jgi:membrane associated rhomboid family serine protease